MTIHPLLQSFTHGLIVSCQALPDEPLYGSEHMAVLAKAAAQGGAVGIRANTPVDIAAIRAAVTLPIIGLYKQESPDFEVYITPTLDSAAAVSAAGADIIALDATLRPHPENRSAADLIRAIHETLHRPVLADIDTLAAAQAAEASGADAVSTTLSGYTAESPRQNAPDFELIHTVSKAISIPVLAEGRFWTVDEVNCAFDLGAYAVVIGAAITRPQLITHRFVSGIAPSAPARAK
jgi:Putative N-acetylmannosamine-6-phosphate epimerase